MCYTNFTRYHWYVLAHQKVRKIDADSYDFHVVSEVQSRPQATVLAEAELRIPEQAAEREKLTAILQAAIDDLRGGESASTEDVASGLLPELHLLEHGDGEDDHGRGKRDEDACGREGREVRPIGR